MRIIRLAVVIFVACNGSNSPDAAGKLAALTCNELTSRAEALVPTLDATCAGDGDCSLVGYVPGSCSGSPELIRSGGAALSTAGAASVELQALDTEFKSRCSSAACSDTNTCQADVGPKLVACTSKVCTGTLRSCNMPHDAPLPDAGLAALTCNDLGARATALVATLDKTCDTIDDCVAIGGAGDCDCAPTLLPSRSGSGEALSKTGAGDAELQAIEAEYAARCKHAACSSTNACYCDAAPALLSCDGHHCTAAQRSCIEPPDAPPTCNDLHATAASLVATLDVACTTADDCVLVGFEAGSCSGDPQLFPGGGAALSKAGAADPTLQALEARFDDQCRRAPCSSTNACSPDSAPSLPVCTAKKCTAQMRSCLPPPPDAP